MKLGPFRDQGALTTPAWSFVKMSREYLVQEYELTRQHRVFTDSKLNDYWVLDCEFGEARWLFNLDNQCRYSCGWEQVKVRPSIPALEQLVLQDTQVFGMSSAVEQAVAQKAEAAEEAPKAAEEAAEEATKAAEEAASWGLVGVSTLLYN